MTDTMETVDHTHPHTGEPFGEPFERGPAVMADGGRDDQSRRADDEQETNEETMEDVDHEASTEDTTRAFERGSEGRDDSV